ncbi:hypothetical protein GA0070560_114139 [Micromonospora halophytica]|uniref:Uncharacterized protein n=1 Tax=Micromonospora halophytica TaxID=47864 RepID=A0A1C5IQ64_9ACTN|nr:hypothetical protein GA0070560_114139 [Micromonospora halophytica]
MPRTVELILPAERTAEVVAAMRRLNPLSLRLQPNLGPSLRAVQGVV